MTRILIHLTIAPAFWRLTARRGWRLVTASSLCSVPINHPLRVDARALVRRGSCLRVCRFAHERRVRRGLYPSSPVQPPHQPSGRRYSTAYSVRFMVLPFAGSEPAGRGPLPARRTRSVRKLGGRGPRRRPAGIPSRPGPLERASDCRAAGAHAEPGASPGAGGSLGVLFTSAGAPRRDSRSARRSPSAGF